MMEESALQVDGLNFAYGTKMALNEVSFKIDKGDCTLLLGPNGAGKSTLFSLITRLYDAPTGMIRLNGFDVRKQTSRALSSLGVVFQQTTLDLDLSVLQNLRYHAALHGMGRKLTSQRIQEELERQGMFERQNEKVRKLNGGHRRRVEIARALLHKPAVLLLDEPTVGLDVPSRQAIVQHVHNLCSESGLAVLWATHLIDEVDGSDQIIVLHKGNVKATGSVGEVVHSAGVKTIDDAFQVLTQGQ